MATAAGAIDPDGTLVVFAIGAYLVAATLALSPVLSVAYALFRERWPRGRSVATVAVLWTAATCTYAIAISATGGEHAWQLAVAVYAQVAAVVVLTVSRPVGGVLSSRP